MILIYQLTFDFKIKKNRNFIKFIITTSLFIKL